MNAIVTEFLKQQILNSFKNDILSGQVPYYVGVSRSEPWANGDSTPAVENTISDQETFRNSLQSVIITNSVSIVVRRYNWSSGTTYDQYDNLKQPSEYTRPYYVLNNNNEVYICLRTGRDNTGAEVPSTVMPFGENLDPFELSDGYVWKFLYTIGAYDANLFMSANYMPVSYQESIDSNSTGNEIKQYNIQQAAKPYLITSFIVDSGGEGYAEPSQLSLNDVIADPAFADVTISGGKVAKVEYIQDSTTLAYQDNVRIANVEIVDSEGSGAAVRAVISTGLGLGGDARQDLNANSLMINAKIPGTYEDFITGQDFRQIGLIKGMKDSANGSYFNQLTGIALTSMSLSSLTSAFTNDNIIVGTTSGAKAWIDNVDGSTIYYHRTPSTGYVEFQDGEAVTEEGGTGAGVIDTAVIPPEVDPLSGTILYLNNRDAIERSENQTEDVKIIIELENCLSL